ncbi:MAG: beta-ketoacyl-ACP synthase III [Candidatus Porifericomitaceae bacterium WSBS_2022_MAG_OTU9]
MNYSAVMAVGGYLPSRVVHNDELASTVDSSDEWISSRTGIKQRHIAAADEGTTSMACHAAAQAIERAGISAKDIDMIVVATTTPEQVFPSVACMVQQQLGMWGIPAFDIQAVCSGFVYAMDIADKYIRNGTCKHVLVIGSDCISRIIDWSDRNTCVLFGDGAGAVVLGCSPEPGIIYSRLKADGRHHSLLHTPGGSGAVDRSGYLQMDGRKIFRLAVELVAADILDVMQKAGLVVADIDWLVPHQANRRIMQKLAERSGIAVEKVLDTIAMHSNTSAASIPLALQQGISDGRVQPGQKLILSGFGGGFTWGTIILHYHGS